jgi:hypothetical protein
MRTDTKTISIHAAPARVVQFLADPQNLPRWAVGFARSVRSTDEGWFVATESGDIGIRIEADIESGVVDFFMSPAPGVEAAANSRVLPNDQGAEYVFTQFQIPGEPDDIFAKKVQALVHELTVLKAVLEVDCPL